MNHPGFREIEKKFRLKLSYPEAANVLLPMFKQYMPLVCKTWDDYWPCSGTGQFVRLRRSRGKMGTATKVLDEITVKAKDRRSNVNRLELNLDVGEQPVVADRLLRQLCGARSVCIQKREYVWFLPGSVVLSLCEVNRSNVYLEVEGPNLKALERITERIKKQLKLVREPKSLYELFVEPSLTK